MWMFVGAATLLRGLHMGFCAVGFSCGIVAGVGGEGCGDGGG